ncbi:hypothetical protein [Exiguobacterium alkaliphilum]|uniref:hypothetical protein n=1 Tax=Exiguobacterium alkaliphilum TaxID=1428684 RepID=UPI001BA53A54|nr:hypothetical protein [Exiguobacterium alkaliphilum]QUE87979.1 hypothetical protein KB235_15565 [Exiguobacterium alkaliphilum]
MVDYNQARKRNLIIKITKSVYEDDFNIETPVDDEIFKSSFYFTNADVIDFKDQLVNGTHLSDSVKQKIQEYVSHINNAKSENDINSLNEEFESLYFKMKEHFRFTKKVSDEDYERLLARAVEISSILHWAFLPLYEEQFLQNTGLIPEDNLNEYYNHFHAIEDLYRWIIGNKDWKSTQGDINLNKNMRFRVYSSRWGHDDSYQVVRTIRGWQFTHLSYNNVECRPNATSINTNDNTGGLFSIFAQDSIQADLDGVKYAFEVLWNEANTTEMNIEDVQRKLDEISNWIEKIERAVKEGQPDWVGYY